MRPDLANGYAVGGICLIRLSRLRPTALPARLGVTTENAAHRIAVVWAGPNGPQRGVYIPRRDTSSRLTTLVAGRMDHPSRTCPAITHRPPRRRMQPPGYQPFY